VRVSPTREETVPGVEGLLDGSNLVELDVCKDAPSTCLLARIQGSILFMVVGGRYGRTKRLRLLKRRVLNGVKPLFRFH
jgi:hypothetical protein